MATAEQNTFWTDERTNILREAVARGDSASMAAKALGCSRSSANSRAVRLGLRFKGSVHKGDMGQRVVSRRKAIIAQLPLEADPSGCDLFSLTRFTCRWPVGLDRYCGAPSSKAYCADHAAIAYQPAKKAPANTGQPGGPRDESHTAAS